MSIKTLSSGTKEVMYMHMTDKAILCTAPILEPDFERCRIPGGLDLWQKSGFYSPGQCFQGYEPRCTQVWPEVTWPIRKGETAVRCIPFGYQCNALDKDQRFAVTQFGSQVLSAPAFEIRWHSTDLRRNTRDFNEEITMGTTTIETMEETSSVPVLPSTPGSSTVAKATTAVVTNAPEVKDVSVSKTTVLGIVGGAVFAFLLAVSICVLTAKKRGKSTAGIKNDMIADAASTSQSQALELDCSPLPHGQGVMSLTELASDSRCGSGVLMRNWDTRPSDAKSAPAELQGETRVGTHAGTI